MRVLSDKNDKLQLDAKDWRILNNIIENPRIPLSKVAKNISLSRQSVEYRLKQMEKNGLITGFKAIVNIGKLGYRSYHIFLTLTTNKSEDLFLEHAKKLPFVNAIITYRGRFNYEISIMAQNIEEFLKYYNLLVKGFSIQEDDTLILLKTIKSEVLPYKFFKKDVEKYNKTNIRKEVPYNPDNTDITIMKELAENSSLTNTELSSKLDMSKDTISYRVKRLIESNYLIQFRPAINFDILNLSVNTILLKLDQYNLTPQDFEKIVAQEDSVLWATRTFGKYDFIIYVISENLGKFHDFFEKIKVIAEGSIKMYELLFAHRQYKYSFMADSIEIKEK